MSKFNRTKVQIKPPFKSRKHNGSQIAEFGPALLLLFFVFFFPIINMFYFFSAFGAAWYLNSIELREVACSLPAAIGLTNPPDGKYHLAVLPQSQNWKGLFGVAEDKAVSPMVMQTALAGNPNGVGLSTVQTTVTLKPFIRMYSLGNFLDFRKIPGLGANYTFTMQNQIEQEEPGP